MMKDRLLFKIGGTELVREIRGKQARTLAALLHAGERGVSILDVCRWAFRLAHYVFKLRWLGLVIETVRERHGGRAPGWHVRYILRTEIQVIEQEWWGS